MTIKYGVRVIALRSLREFWETHEDSEAALRAWHAETERAVWQTPQDIKQRYANASILADNRVCFNIKGNEYRLIVHINYALQIVLIKFIGTHAAYDRVDAENIGFPRV